jgi:hypothetical protein
LKAGLVFSLLVLSITLPNLAFAEQGTADIEVDGKTTTVNYDAAGLTVDGIEADTTTGSLSVSVTTTDVEGSLVIILERSFFDSKSDDVDDDFLVLADSEEAVFTEDKPDSARILTIAVPSGTNSIDIIALGSSPAFGSTPTEPEPEPETPEEIPTEPEPEPEPETPAETPQQTCGPGTVLQDGVCVLETPAEPEPPVETPQEAEQTCGPGTVLQDGVCVLDESCGPGTILKDGVCVLDESTPSGSSKSVTAQFVAPIVAAFVIAMIIMIILWAIGKAGRQK